MTVQTTYGVDHGESYAGMLVDQQLHNTVSRLNKTGVVINWGKGVVTDGDNGAKIPDSGSVATEFNGVVMRELNRAYTDEQAADAGAVPEQDFTVVTHGTIWVTAATIVAKDDPVFLRVGATNVGDFANVVGTGATASVEITNAKFLRTAAAIGDLVPISLGLGG